MRRSFMRTSWACGALAVLAGCQSPMFGFLNGRPFKLISFPPETGQAPATRPATPAAADAGLVPPAAELQTEAAAASDPSVANLNEAVSQFAARFPPPDLDPRMDNAPEARTAGPVQAGGPSTTRPAAAPGVAAHAPDSHKPAPAASTERPAPAPAAVGPSPGSAQPNVSATIIKPASLGTAEPNRNLATAMLASPPPPAPATPPEPSRKRPEVEIVDVRPAPEPAPADTPPIPANQPAGEHAQDPAGDLTRLMAQLEEAVRQHPQQMDDQFRLRMLYLATGRHDRALAPFNGVDPLQAELLSALFRTIAGARDALRGPAGAGGPALGAAADLHRLLAEQTPVVIRKMALVTAVRSFGDYRPVQPPLFPAGQPVHVFCYCEIGNFRTEPTPDGRLRALLAATTEVFDPAGKIVWEHKAPRIEDLVYTPRHDFFVPLEIMLPPTLAPGEYVLKVGIEDRLGATADQQRLTFTVGK